MTQATEFLSVGVVMFIFGGSELAKILWYRKYGKESSLPWWFVGVPAILGLIAGLVSFFANTPTEELLALGGGKKLLLSIWLGLQYAGASVLLYEIRKALQGRKNGNGKEENSITDPN